MKIAYLSITALSDCDLPLLHELQRMADVDYYLIATNTKRRGTAIDIHLKEQGGIFSGTLYPELKNIENWIKMENVYIVNTPVDHEWEWISWKVSWYWMKMLYNNNYDIIHVTWPLRYCSLPLYFLRRKMVLTMHDPIPHSSNITLENIFHRWCAIHSTPHFILLNKTQKAEFMSKYDISEDRIHMSRLSIYTHLSQTIPSEPLCDKPYILYIGSIQPHKGIEYLCQAMEPITKEMPDIQVVIAGKGKYYFDKTKYEHNPQYHFINRFITNEELASLINNAIAVVCPYTDATQSGVIMSAFALNKPVIATNVGALSEMMQNERHGFLVPPKDHHALEIAIRKIMQKGIAQKMSEQIKSDFSTGSQSWKEIAREIYDIYITIIASRK